MGTLRPPAESFRDLMVWQKAHAFVLAVYRITSGLPPQENYGLSLQMRRAAVSVAANIAEGFAKPTLADKAKFLHIARGSLEESRYFLILVQDLGYASTTEQMETLEEVSRMLTAYTRGVLARRFS